MSNTLKSVSAFALLMVALLMAESVFLSLREKGIVKKRVFVKMVALPDLCISTEAKYIRHRSLSDIFSIFSENPQSISYFTTTFVYAPSKVLYNTPDKVTSR